MLSKWIVTGAQWGFVAFSAALTFAVCCAVLFGLLAVIGRLAKGGDGD